MGNTCSTDTESSDAPASQHSTAPQPLDAPASQRITAPEPSDAPASQRSAAPHRARDDQANPCFVAKRIDVGPWGGHGGTRWDDGIYDGVREIKICSGKYIDSIAVVYDKNDQCISAERHGSAGGAPCEIKLQYPEEYLVHVSGHYEQYFENLPNPIIRSLEFKTNMGITYGPYGTVQGKFFSLPIRRGKIVGFMGRSGTALDNIGFHIS